LARDLGGVPQPDAAGVLSIRLALPRLRSGRGRCECASVKDGGPLSSWLCVARLRAGYFAKLADGTEADREHLGACVVRFASTASGRGVALPRLHAAHREPGV